MSVHGCCPPLAPPRASLGVGPPAIINKYQGYAQAGTGAAIAVNPRFRERYQRGTGALPWEPRTAHVSNQYAQAGIGSYEGIDMSYYQTFVHDTPFHAGAPGWVLAPVPGWANNPNLALPRRQAVQGLGAYFANHATAPIGIGQEPSAEEKQSAWDAEKTAVLIAIGALGVLGGLKWWIKNKSKKEAARKR